jgi:sterol desaturase/sphingolipid hydroxylase (fatty acid hydroxylase superfamily)
LIATLFPIVMRKAFGREAGIGAMVITLGAVMAIMMLPILGFLQKTFPVMVVLGPLMVLQYIYWIHRHEHERTFFLRI